MSRRLSSSFLRKRRVAPIIAPVLRGVLARKHPIIFPDAPFSTHGGGVFDVIMLAGSKKRYRGVGRRVALLESNHRLFDLGNRGEHTQQE